VLQRKCGTSFLSFRVFDRLLCLGSIESCVTQSNNHSLKHHIDIALSLGLFDWQQVETTERD
jgi:hypothetical protein